MLLISKKRVTHSIRFNMASSSTIGGNSVEMHDIFRRETEYFRRTKRYAVVTDDEEFAFRLEQLQIELRIKCWHDLKRQEISKSVELMKDGELLMEIRSQKNKLDEWERYLENFKRKRLCLEGLSKLA